MFVAIRIWDKLRRSIPPAFKGYYTLIPDPTARKVTVVARVPSLAMPGLWSTHPQSADDHASLPSEMRGPYSQIHASILAMTMPLAAPSTAMMARIALRDNKSRSTSSLRIGRQYLLRRT